VPEKLKAARYLDATPIKGNIESSECSFLHFTSDQVNQSLNTIGICLGSDTDAIGTSLDKIKNLETAILLEQSTSDSINTVFDIEEKEMTEEEEVDKLILNSLYSEKMDEVMDLDSAHPSDHNTSPRNKSASPSNRSKKSNKKKNKCRTQ
jgi:hypothetical protein